MDSIDVFVPSAAVALITADIDPQAADDLILDPAALQAALHRLPGSLARLAELRASLPEPARRELEDADRALWGTTSAA